MEPQCHTIRWGSIYPIGPDVLKVDGGGLVCYGPGRSNGLAHGGLFHIGCHNDYLPVARCLLGQTRNARTVYSIIVRYQNLHKPWLCTEITKSLTQFS